MKGKILIIEDSETMIQLYKGLLDQFECDIDVARNSSEAKNMISNENYDVYIFDIMIPGDHEGVDFIGKGGARPDKCIILSGHLPEAKVVELVEYHNIDRGRIMIKPPDTKKFIELVMEILLQEENKHTCDKEISEEFEDIDKRFSDEKEELELLEQKVEKLEKDRREKGNGRRESDNVVNWEAVRKILGNLSSKQWFAFISFLVLVPTFLTTYSTYRGYMEHRMYNTRLNEYAQKRFQHFRENHKVTTSTYVKHTFKIDKDEYILKIYPDDFVQLVMTSDKHEPVSQWIAGPKYLKEEGISEDKSFIQIVKKTWLGK